MFGGTIFEAFQGDDGEWFAIIEPTQRGRKVIAPLRNGGEVIFRECEPWVEKGTMPCIPPDGVTVLYEYRPHRYDRRFGFAPVWCEETAWDEAVSDLEDLLLRLRDHEIADLMMPSVFASVCCSRAIEEVPELEHRSFEHGDGGNGDLDLVEVWDIADCRRSRGRLIAPIPVC